MTQKIPPPPFIASEPKFQPLNRWLLELTSILNAQGGIDPGSVSGLGGLTTEVAANTASITTLNGEVSTLNGEVTTINNEITALQAADGLYRLVVPNVNFNVGATDTPVTFNIPGVGLYKVNSIAVGGASASLSAATVGVFTGAGGSGQTIAANQATAALTQTAPDTVGNTIDLTVTNGGTMAYNDTTLYVRVGTPQGSPATATVVLFLRPVV